MKPPGNTFLTSLLRHTSPYRQENPHMTQKSHIYMESFINELSRVENGGTGTTMKILALLVFKIW